MTFRGVHVRARDGRAIAGELTGVHLRTGDYGTAVEAVEAAGAPADALETLSVLVETCREAGDEDDALRWCRRSEKLLAETPPVVTDQHRGWIRDHLAELDRDDEG